MSTSTIRLHRVLRATPERVYRAFLDPDAKVKWLPPNGFTGKVHHMDARVGTGLNLRVAPNDGLEFLTLAVLLAPPLDDAQEFRMLGQKSYQIITPAMLHRATVVIEGATHHLHRDPLQGFPQGL